MESFFSSASDQKMGSTGKLNESVGGSMWNQMNVEKSKKKIIYLFDEWKYFFRESFSFEWRIIKQKSHSVLNKLDYILFIKFFYFIFKVEVSSSMLSY